jgi:hypothetical protein
MMDTVLLMHGMMCIFGMIQMIYSFLTGRIGFFVEGYRLRLGMLSLGGVGNTEGGLQESLLETIPDIVYCIIGIIILIHVKHRQRSRQFLCESGCIVNKVTPAVLLQDFFV